MTITYPYDPPASDLVKISFSPEFAVGQSMSPTTFQGEFFEHVGQRWVASIRLPPMIREDAEEWVAWGLALNGTLGTFRIGDPMGATPRGALGGTPVVDGAGQQLSKTLATRGWSASTLVLKAGDYIQLGNRLHKVLTDSTSDGSGDLTLDIFPRVRDALTDGQAITTTNTKGIWRLSRPLDWSIGAVMYGMSFKAVEAVTV
jgi:hypothetical protein